MDLYDNEIEIINIFQNMFQLIESSLHVLLPEGNKECEEVFQSIVQPEQWKLWVDSSGHGEPPPDFYSDDLGLMMDVMRVDDHGYVGKNGKKIINPTLQCESAATYKLKELGILDLFPDAKPLLTVDTRLPTEEDHNYIFYRDGFIRTIEAHKKKIAGYKKNHPNLKVVFFVFDESLQYFQMTERHREVVAGAKKEGLPHFWFLDEAFVKTFRNSEIDFLIWYTPYKKHCKIFNPEKSPYRYPDAVIIDVNNFSVSTYQYNDMLMESAEV